MAGSRSRKRRRNDNDWTPSYPVYSGNARNNPVLEVAEDLAASMLKENLAVWFQSKFRHFCNLNHKDFHVERCHAQVYIIKFEDGTFKVGSTGNGKKRVFKYNELEEKAYERIASLMDFDKFSVAEDQIIRRLCKEAARRLSFDPDHIPTTLEDYEDIENQLGVNFVLQILFHSIGYSVEDSDLGGIENIQGCGKAIFSRVVESGFQELMSNILDRRTSVHEFLHFDKQAFRSANRRARRLYRKMLKKLLEFGFTKEELKETAKKYRYYVGNWAPGGIIREVAATPLIAMFMMMQGHNFGEDEPFKWYYDAFLDPTTDFQHPYDTSCYTDLQKKEAVRRIRAFLDFIQEKGGWFAMDVNELAFDEIGSSIFEELEDERSGWELVASFEDCLHLYVHVNEDTGTKTVLGVIKPLCYMVNNKFSFDEIDQMTDRAVFAEAFRLLTASCMNGCTGDPPQNKLFDGNIVIAHSAYMFFSLALKGNRKLASLFFKQLLTPIEFNLFLDDYHRLGANEYPWSLRGRRIIRRASNDRTRTADPFIFRKAVLILLGPTSDKIESVMDRVVAHLRDPESPDNSSKRFKKFKEEYLRVQEARDAFEAAVQRQKANRGNRTNHNPNPDVDGLDEFIEYIEDEVEEYGECYFWLPGVRVRGKIEGKQAGDYPIGGNMMWNGTHVWFKVRGDERRRVPFRGGGFKESAFPYDTLKERLVTRNQMTKENNSRSRHVRSKKLCTEDYKLESCSKSGVGPFNVDNNDTKKKGWKLMRISAMHLEPGELARLRIQWNRDNIN